jgi:hypothetical protein
MVLNNDVLGTPTAGGGTGLAPNCAIESEQSDSPGDSPR